MDLTMVAWGLGVEGGGRSCANLDDASWEGARHQSHHGRDFRFALAAAKFI